MLLVKYYEFDKLINENFVDTYDDNVITGEVLNITEREAIIDINAKSEGVISLNEFRYNPDLKIGDSVEGMFVGDADQSLNGYKLQITGGSDKTGRPMRSELEGGNVKSVLITAGTGYKGKRYVKKNSKIYRYKYDGLRRRRNLRGNTISTDTRQLNLKVLEYGKKSLGSILGDEEE